jgi:hypothetical protein
MKPKMGSVFVVMLVFSFLCSGMALAQTDETKDIVVQHVEKIRSDNPDFKITLKPITKGGKVAIGDDVAFEFSSNRDAHVTVVDIGSSGKVNVIFPNKFHKSDKVVKDRVYRIPEKGSKYAFKIKGPVGVNYVKAIGTLKPTKYLSNEALADSEGPFAEMKDPEKTVKDISVELAKEDKKVWTEAQASFKIVARGAAEETSESTPGRTSQSVPIKLWTEKKVYNVGEPITFYFYAERDGYLNLVDFGTRDNAQVIFPNRFQKDNFVKAGQVVAIPAAKEDDFRLKVKGPDGTETVLAVFTTQKLQVYRGSYNFDEHAYQPWEGKGDAIEKDIEVQLQELPREVSFKTKTTFKVVR